MPRRQLSVEEVLILLVESPDRLAALTDGLAPDELHASPHPGEWSANDVLAHLRACADVWGTCIMTIITEERPTLRAVDPRSWMTQTNYPKLEFQPSLRSFTAQRADLLAVLEPLPHEDWSRSAIVTGAGKVLQRTVLSYAQRLAVHERQHVKHVERIARSMRS